MRPYVWTINGATWAALPADIAIFAAAVVFVFFCCARRCRLLRRT